MTRWVVWSAALGLRGAAYRSRARALAAVRWLVERGARVELHDCRAGRRWEWRPSAPRATTRRLEAQATRRGRPPATARRNPRVIAWEARTVTVGDTSGPPLVVDRPRSPEGAIRVRSKAGLMRLLEPLYEKACRLRATRRLRAGRDVVLALEESDPRVLEFLEGTAGERTSPEVLDATHEILRRRRGSLDWRGVLRATARRGWRWVEWWQNPTTAAVLERLQLASGLEVQPPLPVLEDMEADETIRLCREAWAGGMAAAAELVDRLAASARPAELAEAEAVPF